MKTHRVIERTYEYGTRWIIQEKVFLFFWKDLFGNYPEKESAIDQCKQLNKPKFKIIDRVIE